MNKQLCYVCYLQLWRHCVTNSPKAQWLKTVNHLLNSRVYNFVAVGWSWLEMTGLTCYCPMIWLTWAQSRGSSRPWGQNWKATPFQASFDIRLAEVNVETEAKPGLGWVEHPNWVAGPWQRGRWRSHVCSWLSMVGDADSTSSCLPSQGWPWLDTWTTGSVPIRSWEISGVLVSAFCFKLLASSSSKFV